MRDKTEKDIKNYSQISLDNKMGEILEEYQLWEFLLHLLHEDGFMMMAICMVLEVRVERAVMRDCICVALVFTKLSHIP